MSADLSTRRTFSVIVLIVFLVGAVVVLGWLFKAALLALGLAFRVVASCGGLLLLLLIVYLAYRAGKRSKQ